MREKGDLERVRGRRIDREEGDGEGEGDEIGFRRIQRGKEKQMNVRGNGENSKRERVNQTNHLSQETKT